MTSSSVRGNLATQIPQTQNTAPVVEFRCLYTRDLRRKAKRWQDGFLRYHTFNRRVMVYDSLRSFIGDTFNPGGVDLQEGDELDLEKDYVMVEVTEQMGTTQTDLTELMEKRTKHNQGSTSNTPARSRVSQESMGAPYQKHKSLTALLGTPKGQLGKAVLPTLSPFEERQKRKAHIEHGASKRPRLSTAPQAMRQPPPIYSSQGSSPIRRATAPMAKPQHSKEAEKPAVVIDLSSDTVTKDDGVPSSPPQIPPNQLNRGRIGPSQDDARHRNVELAPIPQQPAQDQEASSRRQPLKVISNAPRKMLLCQQTTKRRDKRVQEKTPKDTAPARLKTDTAPVAESPEEAMLAPHQQRLKDRLARIGQKKPVKVVIGSSQGDQGNQSTEAPLPQQATDRSVQARIVRDDALVVQHAQVPKSPPHPQGAEREDNPHQPSAPASIAAARLNAKTTTRQPGDPVMTARRSSLPNAHATVTESKQAQLRTTGDGGKSDDTGYKSTEPAKDKSNSATIKSHQAGRSLSRSGSDPLANPFKPPTRPETRSVARPAQTIEALEPATTANPLDSGPWSREAMDLFDWWPPDRDKKGNRIVPAAGKV
ncbi:Hypothetical protein D9617_7g029540 [Elsinoe fawcettii]|nr:Hypothetical protein D9617_7g029540 [Elsinoe fawcettii]